MFFYCCWTSNHLDIHFLTHLFPNRRSSVLFVDHDARVGGLPGRHPLPGERLIAPGDDLPRQRDDPRRDAAEDQQAEDMRSEEHSSELQSLMRNSYAVFCLKKKHSLTTKHKTKIKPVYT